MDIIDIKTELWEKYYINESKEYLRGYIRCLYDSGKIDDRDYWDLCIFTNNLYE